jgi:hypothetical protein
LTLYSINFSELFFLSLDERPSLPRLAQCYRTPPRAASHCGSGADFLSAFSSRLSEATSSSREATLVFQIENFVQQSSWRGPFPCIQLFSKRDNRASFFPTDAMDGKPEAFPTLDRSHALIHVNGDFLPPAKGVHFARDFSTFRQMKSPPESLRRAAERNCERL